MATAGGHRPTPDPLRRAAIEILVISFVILFQELALIRWLPGQVRVLAYFPNLILIAAFLGLGLGCLRASGRSLLWLWPVSLGVLVATTWGLGQIVFTQSSASEHLWLLYYDLPEEALVIETVQPPIILEFVLAAITFVPLGQLLAIRLEIFRSQSSSLWGYSWDLLGSILGVIVFAACGILGIFPWQWFFLFLVLGLVFFGARGGVRWLLIATTIAIPLTIHQTERAEYYSPYYAITSKPSEGVPGFSVLTNGSLHQTAVPIQSTDELTRGYLLEIREGYHAPYRMLERVPEKVLVLGAGTGNDVATLLDEGVGHIDAVEIDPVIVKLGKDHPNRPYADPRVRVINTDARSFLNSTDETYDLIVFGTLDSMTRLSALSNVRLDNFVYTLDSIRAARARLTDDGGIVMYFMVRPSYIHERLVGMLATVFEQVPLVRTEYSYLFNRAYIVGPAFSHLQPTAQTQAHYFDTELPLIQLPTDDWPYLYLRSRSISPFYLTLIAAFVVIAFASILLVSPEMRRSVREHRRMDLEMFLYGAAFLLLEASFITAMNLLWGATWLTSAIVFGSVLAMILASTINMELKPLPWPLAAGGLALSLLATWFVPLQTLLVDSIAVKLVLSVLYVGLPIFFAAACFAIRFKARVSPGTAIGWNLLGAVCGGLLEFLSMVTGLRALLLVALILYLGAFLLRQRESQKAALESAV